MAIYPHPQYQGDPWSQWGQGVVLADGRFVSAIGDHLGRDGNSYFYVYDPTTSMLTQVADVHSAVAHAQGAWGYGKVHAPMHAGPCGDVYAFTYWGTRRGLEFSDTYTGDVVLVLNVDSGELTSLGTAVPFHGVRSAAKAPEDTLLFGEAISPSSDTATNRGPFFAYDVVAERVVFQSADIDHGPMLTVMVDADGTAYFSGSEGTLLTYTPGTAHVEPFSDRLPGAWLAAASRPGPDGTVYGTTRDPDRLFALHPDGTIEDLGDTGGYVASLALDPAGERLYYMPDAHGGAWRDGTPIIAVDTATGEREVLLELHDLGLEHLGLRLGGTYNVAVGPAGQRLYVGLNAGVGDSSFGEVVLVVVEL